MDTGPASTPAAPPLKPSIWFDVILAPLVLVGLYASLATQSAPLRDLCDQMGLRKMSQRSLWTNLLIDGSPYYWIPMVLVAAWGWIRIARGDRDSARRWYRWSLPIAFLGFLLLEYGALEPMLRIYPR